MPAKSEDGAKQLNEALGPPSPRERDGVLGAGSYAQATRAACIRVRCVGCLHAVHPQLELRKRTERPVIFIVNASNLKDALGADSFAIAFALTTLQVNHGKHHSRLLFTGRCGDTHDGSFRRWQAAKLCPS